MSHLLFISGASSGIGAALARAAVASGARVINISRRPAPDTEHFFADLADPDGWRAVAELFAREVKAFLGDRITFVHSAGTLTPIGPAGDVPAEGYLSQVLLNSASPQVLGDAFLRAARDTVCECRLAIISSGAASNVYEGWSAYGAGKAAVDQWVRTVGAEQDRAGGRCRVVAVAPGVVETPMQEEIRKTSETAFPDLPRFVELYEGDELRDADVVAVELLALLERDLANGTVLDLRDEKG